MEDKLFDIYVFRHPCIEKKNLIEIAFQLENNTRYRRPALREEAPGITDCLTCIYYIFKKALAIDLPLTYIGDMPRQLLTLSDWRPLKIAIRDARCGDILFVKNRENPKLVSHAAIMIDVDRIFHCCPSRGTAVIQQADDFFSLYEQKLNFKKMVRYIDPRNKELREKQGGLYIYN